MSSRGSGAGGKVRYWTVGVGEGGGAEGGVHIASLAIRCVKNDQC
jgi:hypothetical protein